MRAAYLTGTYNNKTSYPVRCYQDPNYIVDDYGNLLNLWERVWEDPTPNDIAAAYYFKHEHTALWGARP